MILEKSIYKSLYGEDANVQSADRRLKKLYKNLVSITNVDKNDEIYMFSSPGRAELGGNHTDHQKGIAVAMALNLDILALVKPRSDMKFNVYSDGFNPVEIDLTDLDKVDSEAGTAASLVRGVAAALDIKGLKIGGADVVTHSIIPRASGLSTSAAFEVLIGNIISFLYNNDIMSPADIAKASWWAENNYYEKPCGMMDQAASATGGIIEFNAGCGANGKAEKIKTKFAGEDFVFIVTNTNSSHSDLTDEYSAIVNEMRAVSEYFGKKVLSEVSKPEFLSSIKDLRESLKNDRAILRAIHYFDENDRAKKMKTVLLKNNLKDFFALVNDSGNSSFEFLQNLYVASNTREQSASLALALSKDFLVGKKGACRIQGGGFGGCIQAYIAKEDKAAYIALMDSVFGKGASVPLAIRDEKAGYITTLIANSLV